MLIKLNWNIADRIAEPTYDELKARVAELERQKRVGSLQFKVSEKAGVSVSGLPKSSLLASRGADHFVTNQVVYGFHARSS